MRELNKDERKKLLSLIHIHIPKYIEELVIAEKFDFLYCYEIGFMFAHDLLRNHKIDPSVSPWGDGDSVIFDPDYANLLESILRKNLSKEINDYCCIFLDSLEIFKDHFI